MKKIMYTSMAAALFIFAACEKDNQPAQQPGGLVNRPEAIAANDTKSGGVYKGVFIGSTGTVKVTLQNNIIAAELTIDGVTKTLTPVNAPQNWTSGQAIEGLTFSGVGWSFKFSVDANGQNPEISDVNIPGHAGATIEIIKETSVSLVKAFEGSFNMGDTAGVLNFTYSTGAQDGLMFGVGQYWPRGTSLAIDGSWFRVSQGDSLFFQMEKIGSAHGMIYDSVATGHIYVKQENGSAPQKWNARRTL